MLGINININDKKLYDCDVTHYYACPMHIQLLNLINISRVIIMEKSIYNFLRINDYWKETNLYYISTIPINKKREGKRKVVWP